MKVLPLIVKVVALLQVVGTMMPLSPIRAKVVSFGNKMEILLT
jgi:hypothetical protein